MSFVVMQTSSDGTSAPVAVSRRFQEARNAAVILAMREAPPAGEYLQRVVEFANMPAAERLVLDFASFQIHEVPTYAEV